MYSAYLFGTVGEPLCCFQACQADFSLPGLIGAGDLPLVASGALFCRQSAMIRKVVRGVRDLVMHRVGQISLIPD